MVKFIADLGSNHNGNLVRAFDIMCAAKDAGCDAVKIQHIRNGELFAPGFGQDAPTLREDEVRLLSEATKNEGLGFGATPCFLDAVQELEPFVDFYKIASYDILWLDLLKKVGATGKPVYASSGLSNMHERSAANDTLRIAGAPKVEWLCCVSAYPASVVSLGDVENFAGYSDHTRSEAIILSAIHAYGAEVIEFHLDLDGSGAEYSKGHVWLPHEAAAMIEKARNWTDPEVAERLWRRDTDGLRPLKEMR